MLPGTTVTVRDSSPPRSAPTDSSVWFVTGFTEKGLQAPVLIESMVDYAAKFGARVSYGLLYDALDVFFREGGSKAYISRVVGPAPVLAAHTFQTAGATASLLVKAKSYGDWGNGLTVAVTQPDGTHYVLAVSLNGTLVETTPSFTTQQQAADWSIGSGYVDITVGAGSGIPAVATSALAAGTDDHANAVEAQWTAALALFAPELGPGQVSAPGRTTDAAHQALLAHAGDNNRIAIADLADTATVATLTAAADAARSDGASGSTFAPWALVPGIAGGTTRTVPYSAVEAGIMARNDSAGLSPNVPAANVNGTAQYAIGLSQPGWNATDRETLNNKGVNVARIINDEVRTYGYRTLANPAGSQLDLELSNARLVMEITAKLQVVADRYVFSQIDGRGLTIGDFAADLAAELIPYYNAGSLYGATPADAFNVDVGAQINPPDQLALGQLSAQANVRLSPFAERVSIFITKRSVTEEVA